MINKIDLHPDRIYRLDEKSSPEMEDANVTLHPDTRRQHFSAARPQTPVRSPAPTLSPREKGPEATYNLMQTFLTIVFSHLAPPVPRLVRCPRLRLHVQPLVSQLPHAAVCLGDRRRGSGTDATMLPAPVTAAAAVRQFSSTTLHIQWTI